MVYDEIMQDQAESVAAGFHRYVPFTKSYTGVRCYTTSDYIEEGRRFMENMYFRNMYYPQMAEQPMEHELYDDIWEKEAALVECGDTCQCQHEENPCIMLHADDWMTV